MWSIPDTLIGALIALCGVLVAQLVAMIQSRIDRNHKSNGLTGQPGVPMILKRRNSHEVLQVSFRGRFRS